jgi:polyisoprenoid-binding protein YceI
MLIMGKLILYLLSSQAVFFQAIPLLKPVDADSEVRFSIKNFGLSVTGRFTGLEGNIHFLPGDLLNSAIDVTIDARTINTGNGARDKHLLKKDYFDVQNHPRISFQSTRILAGSKNGTYIARGKLFIKNTSRIIEIPFTAATVKGGYRFSGSFSINRLDFEVGSSSISLSDILTVSLSIITK